VFCALASSRFAHPKVAGLDGGGSRWPGPPDGRSVTEKPIGDRALRSAATEMRREAAAPCAPAGGRRETAGEHGQGDESAGGPSDRRRRLSLDQPLVHSRSPTPSTGQRPIELARPGRQPDKQAGSVAARAQQLHLSCSGDLCDGCPRASWASKR
jgi:hypothetical protein